MERSSEYHTFSERSENLTCKKHKHTRGDMVSIIVTSVPAAYGIQHIVLFLLCHCVMFILYAIGIQCFTLFQFYRIAVADLSCYSLNGMYPVRSTVVILPLCR
jgi:hypothetical protein